MKKLIPLILIIAGILQFQTSIAQNCISPEWIVNSSGDGWDVVCDMAMDNDGAIYLAGNFTASTAINGNATKLTGGNNSFITKINAEGSTEWLHQISSDVYCYIASICADRSGSIFICGNFKGKLNTGGQTLNSPDRKNAFILKTDSEGNVDWARQIEGKFSNQNLLLESDNAHHLILAGAFSGKLEVDGIKYHSQHFTDILIAKFDEKGGLMTSNKIGGKGNDLVNDLFVNGKNEIFLAGSFEKDLKFEDCVFTSMGGEDAFLLQLDTNLDLLNSKQIGGIYDDYAQSVTMDANGNILLAGSFSGKLRVSEREFLESNGKLDVFLLKFDRNSHLVWAESFGGPANDYLSSIAVNNLNNIFITGSFRGEIRNEEQSLHSVDFTNDIFLAKYDANGNFRMFESIGDINTDIGKKLIVDNANYVYLSGNFNQSLKIIEKRAKNAREEDFFLSKIFDCDATKKIQLPADTALCGEKFTLVADTDFEEYIWNGEPGSSQFYINSTGIYTVEAIDSHGCVSRDTIYVRLNDPPDVDLGDTIRVQQGEIVTLVAPAGMKEYLWSDGSTLPFLDVNTATKEPGNYHYRVEVVDENGCVVEDKVVIEVVGTKMALSTNIMNITQQDFSVSIFPNPVKENLEIYLKNINIESEIIIQMYTIDGVQVLDHKTQSSTRSNSLKFNMNLFDAGSYELRILNGEKVVNKKLVIIN
nr:T9SS type A sorting domain-containing protein [Bacteroidota bacterium]